MANFKDGLPIRPLAADIIKARRAGNQKDNPDALCLPMGFMQFHTHGQPRKYSGYPRLIVIMRSSPITACGDTFSDLTDQRRAALVVWLLGREVEGDTLVVETVGLRDGGWLDIWGMLFGETTKVTERFRRTDLRECRNRRYRGRCEVPNFASSTVTSISSVP